MGVTAETWEAICDPAMLASLTAIANGRDDAGRSLEPSPRVRAAAAAVLSLCRNARPPGTSRPANEPLVPPLPKEGGFSPEEPEIEEPPPGSWGFEPLAAEPSRSDRGERS
ncbi:MAG TPA: hypothetical protein VF170_15495 [Planctomycetaceae bacterium]